MLRWISRRSSRAVLSLGSSLALAALLASATPAAAAEVRQDESVVVASNETIHDDLYAFGQTVTILGTVDGDVFAAGNTVTIGGVVTGSVHAAGATVAVTGQVGHSLRAAGGTVAVSGPVAEDALLAAGTISLAAPARVGRDLLLGGSAQVGAPVGRNVLAGGETLALSAPIGGDVRADVGTLRLASGASIAGALSYTSNRDAEMASGTSVAGSIQRLPRATEPSTPAPTAWSAGSSALDWLRGLIGMLALGLLLVLGFPGFTRRVAVTLASRPWPSLGLGLALLVGAPIVAALVFVLGLLIGGWWLALMVLALYPLALVVGYVLAAATVGQWLVSRWGRADWHRAWALLAGLVLFGLLGLAPVLGGLVLLLALVMGAGAAVLALAESYRSTRPAPQAEVAAAPPSMVPAPSPI